MMKWIAIVAVLAGGMGSPSAWSDEDSSTEPRVRLKNYRQWPEAMSAVTDVSPKHQEIRQYYRNQFTKFPKNGDFKELSVPFILAALSYSNLFCKNMIESDARLEPEERWANQGLNYSKTAKSHSTEERARVIEDYAVLFWGRVPNSEEMPILQEIFEEVANSLPDSVDSLPVVASFLCSSFATSFDFIRN